MPVARRRPLIAGNWKMNGLLSDGMTLAREVGTAAKEEAGSLRCDLLVCPPATLTGVVLGVIADTGGSVSVGGQDCHAERSGAHTGDISAAMLRDLGANYVILGHSERRANHKETDAQVQEKVKAAHAEGLIAIICVGETEAERDKGAALRVVGRQLKKSLPEGCTAANTVIAYEPVWAIGTGRTPTIEEIAEVHGAIRRKCKPLVADNKMLKILYGGSLKPGNAKEILALKDVDGGLIGGASLKSTDFLAIARSCP